MKKYAIKRSQYKFFCRWEILSRLHQNTWEFENYEMSKRAAFNLALRLHQKEIVTIIK